MAQRNPFHSQLPTVDPQLIRNHPPHLHLGNGFILRPVDGAANTSVLRPNDCPSSSFPNYAPTNSTILNDSYLRPPSFVSSTGLPPPSFNQHGNGTVNNQTDSRRPVFKRKSPAMPLTFNGGYPNEYYGEGSSSNLHTAFNPSQPKPMPGPQYWPMDSSRITPSYRSDNHLTVGEPSERNVRSRHNHTLHSEFNPAVTYSSSHLPHHSHAAGHSLPLELRMAGQSSQIPMPTAPRGRILPSDPTFNHEVNPSLAGPSFNNNMVGTNVVSRPNLTQRRSTHSSLPTTHDHLSRGLGFSNNVYNQRSNSYRSSLSCSPVGFATASAEGAGPSRMESVAPSRYSRHPSTIGRNSYRNGRTRNSFGRFQSNYDADSAHSRWFSEGAVLMDQPHFYESRNSFDQHRDMRLDIDNMTYEELLALEERIGNVSTGLSEEAISKCLQETIRFPSNQTEDDQEEESCVICMEEYKERDKLGRLKCRHDFHASCIKNWLLIKNACPICKAAAVEGTSKEKQS